MAATKVDQGRTPHFSLIKDHNNIFALHSYFISAGPETPFYMTALFLLRSHYLSLLDLFHSKQFVDLPPSEPRYYYNCLSLLNTKTFFNCIKK